MKYYVIYDASKCFDAQFINAINAIGYHEELNVVTKYCEMVQESNPDKKFLYEIGKVKSKDLKRLPDYYDLYLVRYGTGYIQAGYMELVENDLVTSIKEISFCKEIILKHLEFSNLSNKDKSVLEKASIILKNLEMDMASDIPSFDDLKVRKMDDEIRRRAMSIWFDFENDPLWTK